MERHSRKLSLATLVICFACGLGTMAFTGQFTGRGAASVRPGEADTAEKWHEWGLAQLSSKKYVDAVFAFDKALAKNPRLQDALYYKAIALGLAGDANAFFPTINKLIIKDPKLAKEILERNELAGIHSDARWLPAYKNAKSQAAD